MEHSCDENMFYNSLDGKWYLRVEGNYWDSRGDCFEYTDIELNYCHVCGEKLINKNTCVE